MYPMSQGQMYPSYQNPYLNYTQRSADNQLIRVNGIAGANAYQMSANSTVALFDCNEDLMYVKTTDGAGFPSIRTFRFEEVSQSNMNTCDYVKKDEFEQFRKEIMEVVGYGKQSVQKSKSKQAIATNDDGE